jgi:acyl-coenzyme A thioesterase PaaI-like protein
MATVDLGVKMLSPVPRDTVLWSRAEVIKLTRRIGVSQASLEDGSGRIYAHATATYMIFR